MFGFVAKHRGVWPVSWMCDALSVSRSGFHAWLTRPRSNRSIRDEELSAAIRASFLRSNRTYGRGGFGTIFSKKVIPVVCIALND